MEKLTIKHLAPYLPYGLKYYPSNESDLFSDLYADHASYSSWNYKLALEAKDDFALKISKSYLTQKKPFFAYENGEIFLGQFNSSLGFDVDDVFESEVKPILRPLSDLTKKISFEENEFMPFDVLNWDFHFTNSIINKIIPILGMAYSDIEYLQQWHFDVFGLIEKGLAIDINTLNK